MISILSQPDPGIAEMVISFPLLPIVMISGLGLMVWVAQFVGPKGK